MHKVIVVDLQNKEIGGCRFPLEECNDWIDYHVNKNTFGKPERWERETDGSHIETREVSNEFETYTEYLMPAEYTYEIVDITEQYNKEQARKEIFERRAKKKLLSENILAILNDHIDQLNLTESQEEAFDVTLDKAYSLLQKSRPDKIKSMIENKSTGQIFTQELKDLLLAEFERFGL